MKIVEITTERLKELEDAEKTLISIQNAGVDNWCGYEDAIEAAEEWINEEKEQST